MIYADRTRQTNRTRPDPTGPQKISNGRKFHAAKRAPNLRVQVAYALCVRAARRGARTRKLFFLYTLEIPNKVLVYNNEKL